MNVHRTLRVIATVLCLSALSIGASVAPAAAPSAEDAQIRALQQQVQDLNEQLARLKSAQGATAQQQAMQRHWSMMQEYLGSVRQMPGMMGSGHMMDHGYMMGQGGMMGGSMMGHGTGPGMSGWMVPSGVTPKAYQQAMQKHMQTMRTQMAAIAAESDPDKRQALMREHYATLYRDMQTMRGMGWMWAPTAAASLPDSASQGAKLLSQYCSQCHATPSPSLHTQNEWNSVIDRMHSHIADESNRGGSGVKVPSSSELDTIHEYLEQHAGGR